MYTSKRRLVSRLLTIIFLGCPALASAGDLELCDSIETYSFANLILGSDWQNLVIERSPEWRTRVFRFDQDEYVMPEFLFTRTQWDRYYDTVTVVVTRWTDFEAIMEPSIEGIYLDEVDARFFAFKGPETTMVSQLRLRNALFPDVHWRNDGKLPLNVRSAEFLSLGKGAEQLFTAVGTVASIGMRYGSSWTRQAYWRWDDERGYLRPTFTFGVHSEESSERGYSTFDATPKWLAVPPDDHGVLSVRRRSIQYHDQQSTIVDPGEIIMEFLDAALICTKMILDNSDTIPLRHRLPTWIVPDSAYSIGGSIPEHSRPTGRSEQVVTERLRDFYYEQDIPTSDSGLAFSFSLVQDSLVMYFSIKPPDCLALWVDSDLWGDFGFPTQTDDDILMYVQTDSSGSQLSASKFKCIERNGDIVLTQLSDLQISSTLSGEYRSCRVSIGRNDAGLVARDHRPIACGFAVEVFRSDVLLADPWAPAGSAYPMGVARFDPRTWSALLIPLRSDSVSAR